MSSSSASSSSSNEDDSSYGSSVVPNSRITASTIVLVFILGFLIFAVHLLAKWVHSYLNRPTRRRRRRDGIIIALHEDDLRPPCGCGLDKSAISQLPSFTFKSGVPNVECAVCLSDFEDNEQGRLLPACKHSFHIDCIDMWLYSHSTCPLCRTRVAIDDVNTSENSPAAPDASTHPAEHTITIMTEQPESSSRSADDAGNSVKSPPRRVLSIQIPSRPDPAALILQGPSPGACLSLPPGLCRRPSPSPGATRAASPASARLAFKRMLSCGAQSSFSVHIDYNGN